MIVKCLFLFTKLWLWNLWHLLWTWSRVCVPKKLTKEMRLGREGRRSVRTVYFLKTATRRGCAGFCSKYLTLICRVDAGAWFYAHLFSVPSCRQPCISLGACSRAPAAARGATFTQRDSGRLHAPGGSPAAPHKRGQVKQHCLLPGSRVWGMRAARVINHSQIHEFIN